MAAVLGRSWDGAGVSCGVGLGQVESQPQRSQAGLEQGVLEMSVVILTPKPTLCRPGNSGEPRRR